MDVDYQAPVEQRDAKEAVGRTQQGKKVSYYYDHDVGNFSYGLGHPMKPHRMRMTHSLVTNYGLLDKMDVFRPTRPTTDQLTRFHSDEYIDFLQKVTPETVEELTGSGSRFLTGEDCPAFEGLFEFCSISAGGSINAAERLNAGQANVAINWAGGLHHAKKREASGFCYVNDIVLSILELLRFHPRVLYIDIDVHHGDGVEEAFYSTDRVMTASFHKYGDFFPGTGDVRDVGIARGKNYAVNVPLRDGITDESYKSIFEPVIQHIMDWYRPGAIVLQCGADSLAGDKLGVFNLSMKGHADCVKFVSKFDVPMLVVGGGGYTTKNVSRTWTYETGVILGQELNENLPYNDYLEYFGPVYRLEVPPSNMDDQNSPQYLEDIKSRVIDSLRSMPFAPSVGMHEVPRSTVGKEIGVFGEGAESDEEELDVVINQRLRQINAANAAQDVDSDDSRMDTDDDEPHRHSRPHVRSRKPLSSRPPQFTASLNPSRPLQPTLHAHSHIPRPAVGPRAHSFGEGLEALVAAKAAPRKFNGPFPKVIRKPKRSFFAGASGLGLGGGFGTTATAGAGGGVVGGAFGGGDGTDTEGGGSDAGEGWGAWKTDAVEKGIGGGGRGQQGW